MNKMNKIKIVSKKHAKSYIEIVKKPKTGAEYKRMSN